MRPSDKAWLALAAGVLAWDAVCPRGEMLSEASARYMGARPILTGAIIIYTAGHLMHVWPRRGDLFTMSATLFGR
ncbi:DUF7427 family protein [Mycobacterium malmoense]|uniref:DUF7427 family protein n=1 Tax=Mycobacterium malmoense TaxID=1780 RepID=UPI0008F8F1C6|nr:hypothetical protein [Mycobacterium malmoense]OIN79786.1 hypothetical protein BMG05_16705 [Mycobacterium malmoense]